MCGDKQYLKWNEIRVWKVPQLKTLSVGAILEYARRETDIDKFLPNYEYRKLPNRDWLWNIVHTIMGDRFKEFIQLKLAERADRIAKSKMTEFITQQEFIHLFKKSNLISSQSGRTHFLVKPEEEDNTETMERPPKNSFLMHRRRQML